MAWNTALSDPEAKQHAYTAFEQSLTVLETEAFNFGHRFINDAAVRSQYLANIAEMAAEMTERLHRGEISAYQAADQATLLRNHIMELSRLKLSEVGRAYSVELKSAGKTLEGLCQHYAGKLYSSDFTHLTASQQDQVYRSIVEGAGRARPSATRFAVVLGRAGRGLLALTLAIAVYHVATADNVPRAAAKEGVIIGGGVLGGAAGAATGLLCGPGAPVCVTLLVFVGGVGGALGAEFAFDSLF